MEGKVKAVCLGKVKGEPKQEQPEVRLALASIPTEANAPNTTLAKMVFTGGITPA